MFIAVSHSDERRVKIYSTNYESGFMKFRKVRLPRDANLSNTFTLMDTSEQQVFLFIENHGETSPFGNLYISDEKGRTFTLSMTNVIKGHAVDFEKINSLDGTYVLNRYNKPLKGQHSFKNANYQEFDESDMIAEETRKGRMQSRSTKAGGKMSQSSQDVQRIPDSIPEQEVYDNVRSYITHNKGANWELLRAPSVTSKGSPIDCHIEDDCSLHMEIYSHNGHLAPVYSTETSVGVVLATGNLGKRLSGPSDAKNLYISRDGGMTWKSVRPGAYIYEIGDHGAILVIAKHMEAVTEIEFSWDEGLNWTTLKIADEPVWVQNIIIEPNSLS